MKIRDERQARFELDLLHLAAEWWKSDVEAVIDEAMTSGGAPNVSDAHTINSRPGPVANCPQGTRKEEQRCGHEN